MEFWQIHHKESTYIFVIYKDKSSKHRSCFSHSNTVGM